MTARERGHVAPLSADRFHAQFTMSAQTKDKLELALDLMSHSNPRRSLVAVFDRALDSLLQDLEKKRLGKTNRPRRSGGAKRGNISRATLRAVYERDGVRCSFVSESGARCISRLFLQTDHVVARAQGGSGELHNARILCGPHNRFEAEKTFGEAHVARRICERRERTRRDEGASEAEGAAEAAVAAAKTRGAAEAPEAEAALGAVSQPLAPATEAQATSTTLPSPVAVGWQAETAESSQRMAKRESSQRMAERESSQRMAKRESSQRMAKRESSQRMAKRESSQRMAKRAPPQRDASEVREMLFRALTTMGFRKSETNRALAQLEHRRSRTPDALWSERETLLEAPLDMLLREALALLMP
jgi:5-methylcytosine-specific restriction endonuclease McrA